jgi:hypothetical protein
MSTENGASSFPSSLRLSSHPLCFQTHSDTLPEPHVGDGTFVLADKSRPEPASPNTSGTSAAAAARICQAAMRLTVARTDSLRGGFSNVVYRISFLGNHPPALFRSAHSGSTDVIMKDAIIEPVTPERRLYRFFGLGREPVVEAQHENAVFMLLSQHAIAPKIFASSSSPASASIVPAFSLSGASSDTSFGALAEVHTRLRHQNHNESSRRKN